jgi:hypothetical protein
VSELETLEDLAQFRFFFAAMPAAVVDVETPPLVLCERVASIEEALAAADQE